MILRYGLAIINAGLLSFLIAICLPTSLVGFILAVVGSIIIGSYV